MAWALRVVACPGGGVDPQQIPERSSKPKDPILGFRLPSVLKVRATHLATRRALPPTPRVFGPRVFLWAGRGEHCLLPEMFPLRVLQHSTLTPRGIVCSKVQPPTCLRAPHGPASLPRVSPPVPRVMPPNTSSRPTRACPPTCLAPQRGLPSTRASPPIRTPCHPTRLCPQRMLPPPLPLCLAPHVPAPRVRPQVLTFLQLAPQLLGSCPPCALPPRALQLPMHSAPRPPMRLAPPPGAHLP